MPNKSIYITKTYFNIDPAKLEPGTSTSSHYRISASSISTYFYAYQYNSTSCLVINSSSFSIGWYSPTYNSQSGGYFKIVTRESVANALIDGMLSNNVISNGTNGQYTFEGYLKYQTSNSRSYASKLNGTFEINDNIVSNLDIDNVYYGSDINDTCSFYFTYIR